MRFLETTGPRFALALERLRAGDTVSREELSFVLRPDGVLEVGVESAWRAENATVAAARAELLRAEQAVTALLEASPELAEVVGDRPRRFVLLDDYGMGAIELARYESGEFRWLSERPPLT